VADINIQPNIKVVDSIMGSGKTSWAIDMINSDTCFDRHFLFVTPFLDEVKRIKESCEIKRFADPKIFSDKGKLVCKKDHFKRLLTDGKNIVTTHAMFKIMDKETINLLYINNYTLILDEVMDVIEELNIKPKDVEMLKEKWILIDENTGKVSWNVDQEKLEEYDGVFNTIRELAINGNLILFQNKILLWKFPIEVFKAFEEVYILTYLFDGQPQRYYYDMNKIKYNKYQVKQVHDQHKYKLIPFDTVNEKEVKLNIKNKINIYEGALNKIGENETALSKSWYTKDEKYKCKLLKKTIYNYFHNIVKSKSDLNMWTTFATFRGRLKGSGYTKGFVSCNSRATNQYASKHYLVYMVNRFESPIIVNYFYSRGNIDIDQEYYALAEFIQWIWRSGIRNNEEIYLFVPSLRMRKLLIDWLNN
jgi:hypothetical protein